MSESLQYTTIYIPRSQGCSNTSPQGYFESPLLCETLKQVYRIIAEPIGSFCHLSQQKSVKGPPFLLDPYSLAMLIKNYKEKFIFDSISSFPLERIVNGDSFRVFQDLHEKGYFIITAKKFGAEFLAYDKDPQQNHAKYLVFLSHDAAASQEESQNLICINRLTTIAKKEGLLAKVCQTNNKINVSYTKMVRLQHY